MALAPLKEGTARLAISSWADGIPLKVLPVAINYSSFKRFGKNIRVFFGDFILKDAVNFEEGYGRSIQAFNINLEDQLKPFVFEIGQWDKAKLRELFYVHQPLLKTILAFLPSLAGWLLHAPLYYPVKIFVAKKTTSTDHFDSVVIAMLFLLYPFYITFVTILIFICSGLWYSFLLVLP